MFNTITFSSLNYPNFSTSSHFGKPREDVRKGYLLGRYGAIPLLPQEAMKW